MSHLPPSLTRHSPMWFVALTLGIVGDLAGMLATFMPMKAVLILASGEVPGFFPSFLVDRGTVFASLVLLAAAGIFGLVNWVATQAIASLDRGPRAAEVAGEGLIADWSVEASREAWGTRKFETSAVLIAPIASVLAAVSPAYLGFSLVFLGASALTVLWRVWRPSNESAHFSGVDQASHELSAWLQSSALWSMVAVALVTLLIAPPALGSTAILIAAIFGRRLTIAVAELLPRAATLATEHFAKELRSGASIFITNKPTASIVRFPIDYLATVPGSRKLGDFLNAEGYERGDFRVVGASRGPVASLIAGPQQQSQLLLRVFGRNHEESRRLELSKREQLGRVSPYSLQETRPCFVAGLPSLAVRLRDDTERLHPTGEPSWEQVVSLQLRLEIESIGRLVTQQGALYRRRLQEEELVEALHRAARLPGGHSRACESMISLIPDALAVVDQLPISVVPSSPLRPRDCYLTISGDAAYLGGHRWVIGRAGDAWGRSALYSRLLDNPIPGLALYASGDKAAMLLNAELNSLKQSLESFDLKRIASGITAVKRRMRDLA